MKLRLGFAIGLMFAPARSAIGQELKGFDEYVARTMRDWQIPGLAVAVVHDDSIVFMKGYGVREAGKPEPVTVHTRFGVMSTTKAFTALLVAMLVDSGKVSLDAPVTRYLPELELRDPWVTRELTVRDLLTHRIGFPDPDYLWYAEPLELPEVIRRLRMVPVASSLRSHFAYNNVAYALAGEIVSRAGGMPWAEQMRRRIYGPLGMTESVPDQGELDRLRIGDVTSPHGLVRDTVRLLDLPVPPVDPIAPAGAMFASIQDMAKWMRFLLDSGRVGRQRLVSPGSLRQLFAPQQIVPPDEFYPTMERTHPHYTAYGLGWFLEDYRGAFVAFHTGSIDGRSAIIGLLPDRRVGVVVLTNLDHSELRHALMYTVFDRFLGAEARPHDWSAELHTLYRALADSALTRRRAREARRVMNTRPTLPIERFAGTYTDSLYGTLTVEMAGDRPVVRWGVLTGDLSHWQYDTFRVTWRSPLADPDYLAFGLDAAGSPGDVRFVDSPIQFRRKGTRAAQE